MCGFTGFVEFGGSHLRQEDLLAMRQCLRHRGPDDEGHWFKPGVGLAHARLAILDLSANAHQPMRRGNLILVYNGEIYNYVQLRRQLQELGHAFASTSDTEVLLCGFAQWGPAVLERLDGMFAFAIYDEAAQTLFVARDKMGIKPLFYYSTPKNIVFTSELKALWPCPGVSKELSSEGLEDYLRLGYTTGRVTMFKNCFRLLPGECLLINAIKGIVERQQYWPGYFKGIQELDFISARVQLKSLLTSAVKMSLASDVPVGLCLSGGVDSNILAGILAKEHGIRLNTYSLGSGGMAFDENTQAAAVAKYLGTRHCPLTISEADARALVMDTISHYDEPMADQNILSMRVIARHAKAQGVKVLLSGLGGDELFWGYPSIDWLVKLKCFYALPQALRCLPPLPWLAFSNRAYKATHLGQQRDFYAALSSYLGNCFFDDEARKLMPQAAGQPPSHGYFKEIFERQQKAGGGVVESLMRVDLRSYLPDNGLALTDMSSMAEGLEMRVPYLNAPIVDFALRVPSAVKKHQGQLKGLLRSIEAEYIPAQLALRRKQGFYPFVKATWLNGPLKDLTRSYLSPEHIRRQGIFNVQALQEMLKAPQGSKVNVTGKLWNMLMFQLWAEKHL